MHRRCFSSTSHRLGLLAADAKPKKKTHWALQIKAFNNVERALAHYDDFYASVFGSQWPSLRLGLLSPPKYMAIPNAFTGSIDQISEKLEKMGAYDVSKLWGSHHTALMEERKEIDLKKDPGRLHQLDKTLESIAATKRAEEMDVLYQNATTSKREEIKMGRAPHGRVISDVSQAAADFFPSTKLKGVEDFTFDSEYFASYLKKHDNPEDEYYGLSDSDVIDKTGGGGGDEQEIQFLRKPISSLEIPQLLVPYSFENGSATVFPAASRDNATNLREYICVNGSSILPVIALDLRPGTNLLDLCAGPGTKSILSLMTMSVDAITCNDLEQSRMQRVKRIMQEFTGSSYPSNVDYTKFNARDYPAREEFSRVLANVPFLNDRVSCTVLDNNIFKACRTKERLALVKTQKEILLSGFKALERKESSTIVYSTCTLSPIENDGVVMNALKETEVGDLHIDLIGLMRLVIPFERAGIFRISRTRCGVLVMPSTFSNFGPMYISRMVVKLPQGENQKGGVMMSGSNEIDNTNAKTSHEEEGKATEKKEDDAVDK